jgi:hypothetical protein
MPSLCHPLSLFMQPPLFFGNIVRHFYRKNIPLNLYSGERRSPRSPARLRTRRKKGAFSLAGHRQGLREFSPILAVFITLACIQLALRRLARVDF